MTPDDQGLGEIPSHIRSTSRDGLAPDTVVGGQFKITGPGKAGGMGVVYPARDLEMDEVCAVKVMHAHLVASDGAVGRFREEARNARRLRHPGTVQVRHFGDWNGQKYMVMEWVGGGSLREELARRKKATGQGRLPVQEALGLVRRVAEGLAYAHGEGVIHLDLKPENVLLDGEPGTDALVRGGGRPKISDFGLSRLLSTQQLRQSGMADGTAYYMAPERLVEGAPPDARMDVYSVGVILYEMLCGRLPMGRFRLPHELDAALPEALDEVIERCLDFQPEERYATAEEMGAALAGAQDAFAAPAAPPRPTPKKTPKASPPRPEPTEAPTVIRPSKPKREKSPDPSEMVEIPAGEFLMGEELGNGSPPHRIWLDAFAMDKDPVTNARWRRFMEAGGYRERKWWSPEGWQWREANKIGEPRHWNDAKLNTPEQPVVGVSWYEAEAFCRWAGKRLPTEAEWEKAARGTDGRQYPWGNEWDTSLANTGESGIGKTTPVGQYPQGASPYGVRDMAGNVCQWLADWYEEEYYRRSPARNPTGPESGQKMKVLRGGSWGRDRFSVRAPYRKYWFPQLRDASIGFRCARGSS